MNYIKQFSYTSILPVLTALAVCLFFGLCYPHHLHYQEQFQLFLFDTDYALDVTSVPGGVADYLGRFITQFFLFAWPGATLVGLLIGSVYALAARKVSQGWLGFLAVLPALLLVRMLCDENFLFGSVVAILLVQLSAWGVNAITGNMPRYIAALLALPLLYWAAGPITFLFVALVAIEEVRKGIRLSSVAFLAMLLVMVLALPALASQYLPYPQEQLYTGVHYLRNINIDATPLWLAVVAAAAPALGTLLWKRGGEAAKKTWQPALLSIVVTIAGCAALIYPAYNGKAEEVMGYDFMARMQQWNRIQRTAIQNPPKNAICATVLNLSLAKTGQLGNSMFEYSQRGTAGLLPPFERDAMSPLATSEVFYHLGMINTAQRFTFEAQEAILDYQKSARCYKRLAETSLIDGNYTVSRKYLQTLQKTFFYRNWAKETLQLLGDEEAIDNHPEYGPLRKMHIKSDSFYSEYDYQKMLQELYLSNKSNKMAYDYLLATCLLQRDLDNFVNYFGMNESAGNGDIPTYYQQALLLWWSRDHGADQIPPGIRPDIANGLKRFITDLQNRRTNQAWIEQHYGKTYWYYFTRN